MFERPDKQDERRFVQETTDLAVQREMERAIKQFQRQLKRQEVIIQKRINDSTKYQC